MVDGEQPAEGDYEDGQGYGGGGSGLGGKGRRGAVILAFN